ncbi:MAG: anhydro-N-acetylmuramic acid kinase [Rhodospirillales bacterium]|nr:anhydro-N-acetylmuramic acid kinase [Rhodospirillales bacterium]
MSDPKTRRALGLMSGTSMDGIDAAVLDTDGETAQSTGVRISFLYQDDFRARLIEAVRAKAADDSLIAQMTELHADAVAKCLEAGGIAAAEIDVIGFHGHTIFHDPDGGRTLQIGDAAMLARLTGIPVVSDFRTKDVAAGGEGAPLAPIYHHVLSAAEEHPLAVLNIGGVANVTWLGGNADSATGEDFLAFDTGPGNALIDDWMREGVNKDFDEGGGCAAKGTPDPALIEKWMSAAYFGRKPPKSLDRQDFNPAGVEGLNLEDGAASLSMFTAQSIVRAAGHFPASVSQWIVTGGGRKNRYIMEALGASLSAPVRAAEELGWDGDALEAQAFALLAVRSLMGKPITYPRTTGAPAPMTGGRLFKP